VALATRNLYLVLKARDEASRVIRGFGRELDRAGTLARAEALRQRASMISLQSMQDSLVRQQEINDLRRRALAQRQRAEMLRETGASSARIQAAIRHSKALSLEATELSRANSVAAKTAQAAAAALTNEALSLEQSHKNAIRLSNALHTVSATLITIGSLLVVGGAAGMFVLFQMAKSAADYAKQVALTRTQVTDFKVSLKELSDIGLQVAQKIAVPFEQIQRALYNIFSSTNASLAESKILLEGFAKTAVAGQVSIEDAARGTIPILNAFNIPLNKVNDILDIQFQLVRKGVGTYEEFSKVFGKVVPSATRAGQSFQTVAAMLAFMTRNGQTAAMASTSAARALEAFSHPKAVANLEAMGIKMRDIKGNFLPLEQILTSLRDKLNTMPPASRVQALVEIFKGAGGTIQARRFIEQVLLRPGELEEYIGFLDDMKHANGAFGSAYGEMSNTVAAQTELMRNKWKVLQVTVGQIVTPAFIIIIALIQKVLDWFNHLSPKWQRIITLGFLFGSMLGIVGGAVVVFLGAIVGLAAAIMSAGASFFYLVGGVVAIVVALGALTAAFVAAVTKSAHFRKLVQGIRDDTVEFWKDTLVPAAIAVKKAFDEDMRPALERLVYLFENRVLPVVLSVYAAFMEKAVPAAKEIANTVKDALIFAFAAFSWMVNNMVIPAVERLTVFYYEHKATIDQVVSVLIWLGKNLGKAAIMFAAVGAVVGGAAVIGSLIFLITVIENTIAVLKFIIGIVRSVVNWFKDLGDSSSGAGTAVTRTWANTMDFMKTIPGKIILALGSLATLLVHSGEELIMGLIHGIEHKIGDLGNMVKKAAQTVKDFWPFSPAKTGPLSGTGSLFYAGQSMMEQLQKGIESVTPALAMTTGAAAHAVADRLSEPPQSASRTVNQTITINTQQLSPRRLSSDLGFALAGVS
jgi:TP901 family phage tail tape measure protein